MHTATDGRFLLPVCEGVPFCLRAAAGAAAVLALQLLI
jgi:hypothetical protein